jgi:hypothetical protein
LASRYGVKALSFVELIWKPILRERGVSPTRHNLQLLGLELMRDRGPESLVGELMSIIDPVDESDCFCIDDVRTESVYSAIKSEQPASVLVFIEASFDSRLPRVMRRDGIGGAEEQKSAELVGTELGIADLRASADLVIVNEGEPSRLHASLDLLARSLMLTER